MQRRLVRKLDLELMLSKVKPHPKPKPELEQYTISADAAASILYLAAYQNNDIVGRSVLDMGCGTGRLALGAVFLGAREVVGVDIDKTAVKTAFDNSVETYLEKKMQWIVSDIDSVQGDFDTVLQNPPFGVQKRQADRKFISRALKLGRVVYSIHKRPHVDLKLAKRLKSSATGLLEVPPSPFIERFVERNDGEIQNTYSLLMTIPYMFDFHTEKEHEFIVDLYVMRRRSSTNQNIY